MQLFKGNKLTLFNLFAKKERNARGADDLTRSKRRRLRRPCRRSYGKYCWTTGPTPTYKFGDQWVVSDRLLIDVQYTHVGNNFVLDFHSPDCVTSKPFTSPAKCVANFEWSKCVIGPIPDLPASSPCHVSSVPTAIGVTSPIPVTTTLRAIRVRSFGRAYFACPLM